MEGVAGRRETDAAPGMSSEQDKSEVQNLPPIEVRPLIRSNGGGSCDNPCRGLQLQLETGQVGKLTTAPPRTDFPGAGDTRDGVKPGKVAASSLWSSEGS